MDTVAKTYQIFYDANIDAVVMKWHGYATSAQFKEGTELMLNTLIKHQCYKVLADIKEMTIIGMEDQKWLEEQFLPRAIEFGFKAIAIVKPDHYFNKVAIESISYKIDKNKITLTLFDNLAEATAWLKGI